MNIIRANVPLINFREHDKYLWDMLRKYLYEQAFGLNSVFPHNLNTFLSSIPSDTVIDSFYDQLRTL